MLGRHKLIPTTIRCCLKKPDTLSSSTHLPAASWATRFPVIRTEITFAYNTDEFEEFSPQSDCKLECWQALQIQWCTDEL